MQKNKKRAAEATPDKTKTQRHKDSENLIPDKICHALDADYDLVMADDTYGFVSAKVLFDMDVEKIPCLVEPILPASGIVAIAGPSDCGKSAFLRYLSICIALKKPDFLGWKINAKYHKVLFASTEDDNTATSFLLRKQCTNDGGDLDQLNNLSFAFETDNLTNRIDKMLSQSPCDLVCVDCFSDLYGGEMNQNNKVRFFLNDFKQLAVKHECLFFFLHHTRKQSETFTPSKNNLIGSQGFEASMRLVLELRNDLTDARLKHLCIVKGNYLPSQFKYDAYDLIFDENLRFTNTGKRTPFESIRQADDSKAELYDKAVTLKNQGKSLQQIATELGYKNKSSVSRLIGTVAVANSLEKSNEQRPKNNTVAEVLPQSNNEQHQSNIHEDLPF